MINEQFTHTQKNNIKNYIIFINNNRINEGSGNKGNKKHRNVTCWMMSPSRKMIIMKKKMFVNEQHINWMIVITG